MLLLVDCKYKILHQEPSYQKLVSVNNEELIKQKNKTDEDVETRSVKVVLNKNQSKIS